MTPSGATKAEISSTLLITVVQSYDTTGHWVGYWQEDGVALHLPPCLLELNLVYGQTGHGLLHNLKLGCIRNQQPDA